MSWDDVAETFLAALELAPEVRVAWLDEACRGRPELRREVDEMIAAHEDPRPLAIEERLLAEAAAGADAGDAPVPRAGERVGAYRLVRLLGRGGMGEVYLAERADGEYHGQVAIKFLAGGTNVFGRDGSGDRERRLRRERQILASLSHPGIATLHDGGIAGDGQPYLVMEYVDGRPIDEYCAERRLTIRERLELFVRVCDAVQYAHARLVVHRDLKPSNLLVTGDGTSKLLDFGIAKLLEGSDAEPPPVSGAAGALTRTQMRVFTPCRAAPEQIRGEPVSTATDVYALGVLLFELLTGRLPAEEGAPRLPRELRGDLEGILAKSLAPRPEERYAAAGFLADDVRRYLEGGPVQARRQTWIYRSRKLVRRHAIPVAALVLAATALAGAALFAASQARRAAQDRDLALAGEQRPTAAMDGSGSKRVAESLTHLGFTLAQQGRYGEAEAAFRRGYDLCAARLGADHPDTAHALRNVGRAQQLQRHYPEALVSLRRAAESLAFEHAPRARAGIRYQVARVAWLVEHSPESLAEMRFATRLLVEQPAGPLDPHPADAMVALGLTLLEAGRPEESAEVLAEALERRRASGHGRRAIEARCALRLAQQAKGAPPRLRELRACATALPTWGLTDPELVARFAPWRR